MIRNLIRPNAHFVVGEHEGRKVFTLGNIRFPLLPVETVLESERTFVNIDVFRRDGSKLSGMIRVSTDFPNGVAGTPPYFDMYDMKLRRETELQAESFEEGDLLYLTNLPFRFGESLLKQLGEQADVCREYIERHKLLLDDVFRRCEAIRTDNGAELTDDQTNMIFGQFYRSVGELFQELKERTDLPELFELRETEPA
ncbi:MAG: hypothetical protein AB203_02605 [Parcubacteria bacterium C7867-008]|nr:MAG: hypothetical protein AB203_02605 [Parcubacteria bacterium C7867-008]